MKNMQVFELYVLTVMAIYHLEYSLATPFESNSISKLFKRTQDSSLATSRLYLHNQHNNRTAQDPSSRYPRPREWQCRAEDHWLNLGQNKNRYVLAYFSWRTMTGRHKAITYMMQIPGHTRCLIDAGFGRIKQLYRRSDVDTVDQAGEIISRSSFSNEAFMFGNENWKWRQRKNFFGDRFKKVPNISKYHSFRFTADEPGVVYMKISACDEAEVRFVICKTNLLQMNPANTPPEVHAGGLSSERHKYLYKHVRPLVRQQFQDIFCPPLIST